LATGASDASAAALPDVMPDVPQAHSDAAVEKWVDPAQDVRVQVAQGRLLIVLRARRLAEALCKPDAAPSAA